MCTLQWVLPLFQIMMGFITVLRCFNYMVCSWFGLILLFCWLGSLGCNSESNAMIRNSGPSGRRLRKGALGDQKRLEQTNQNPLFSSPLCWLKQGIVACLLRWGWVQSISIGCSISTHGREEFFTRLVLTAMLSFNTVIERIDQIRVCTEIYLKFKHPFTFLASM